MYGFDFWEFLPFGIVILLIVISLIFERVHYKKIETKPVAEDWIRTAERFIDPETGVLVEVYVHPPTGERKYVEVNDAASSP